MKVDEWKPSGEGLVYDDDDLKIIKKIEPLAIIAGPGTGKTEMMAQKACFLLQTRTCPPPYRILGLSYKVDAAETIRKRVKKRVGDKLASRFDSLTIHAFAKSVVDRFMNLLPDCKVKPDYRIGKNKRGDGKDGEEISFNELIKYSKEIFSTCERLRNIYTNAYKFVLLDEFQDTTRSQYDLITTIFKGSSSILCAVGDPKQSIMLPLMRPDNDIPVFSPGISNIFGQFQSDFNATEKKLVRNHRSTMALQYLQSFIANMIDTSVKIPPPPSPGDIAKACEIRVFPDCDEEANYIVSSIVELNKNGTSLKDIAVLYARDRGVDYSSALIEQVRRKRLLARKDKDLNDFLKDKFFLFLVTCIQVAIGVKSAEVREDFNEYLYHVFGFDEGTNISTISRTREEISVVFKEIKKEIPQARKPDELVDFITKIHDCFGHQRLFSFFHVNNPAEHYEKCRRFCEKLVEMHELEQDWSRIFQAVEGRETLNIITIHRCKSREFDTVYLMGLDDRAFSDELDEDNWKLIFVGFSRAKKKVIITYCPERGMGTRRGTRRDRCMPVYDALKNAGVKEESSVETRN